MGTLLTRELMSSGTRRFSKNTYFPAQLLQNNYLLPTGGDLLTLTCLFHFKMYWRCAKVSISLNTACIHSRLYTRHDSDKQL